MKQKILSVLLLLCLSVSLFSAMGLTSDAADPTADKAIMLGMGEIDGYHATDLYDYLYLGNYEESDIKWRVLDDKTNTGESGYFLFADYTLGTTVFRTEANSFDYQGSVAQAWCTAFAQECFSATEQALLIATTKTDNASTGMFAEFDYTENILNGDKVFFLSAEEIQNADYGIQATSTSSLSAWWGRSPGRKTFGSSGYEACVYTHVTNWVTASGVAGSSGARPALNLNPSKVLFTSAAAGGKNAKFGAVADYTGNEWKLTLLDSSASISLGQSTIKGAPGRYSTEFEYISSYFGANAYISAMLVDGNDNILYYGNLCQSQANGKTRVLIPAELTDGNYTLRVFAEQCNGDYKTDYATNYKEITLTVESGTHLSTHDGVTFDQVLSANDTSLASGCYYLTENVTMGALSLQSGASVTICLNGYTLSPSMIRVQSGRSLTICDCAGGGGVLTSNPSALDTPIIIDQGSFTLRDGTLQGLYRIAAIYNS